MQNLNSVESSATEEELNLYEQYQKAEPGSSTERFIIHRFRQLPIRDTELDAVARCLVSTRVMVREFVQSHPEYEQKVAERIGDLDNLCIVPGVVTRLQMGQLSLQEAQEITNTICQRVHAIESEQAMA